jgi:hypothetical protein
MPIAHGIFIGRIRTARIVAIGAGVIALLSLARVARVAEPNCGQALVAGPPQSLGMEKDETNGSNGGVWMYNLCCLGIQNGNPGLFPFSSIWSVPARRKGHI